MSTIFQSPAQINFFHVSEKVVVQSINGLKRFCANEKRSSRRPEDFPIRGILSTVRLEDFKDSTGTKGESVPVNVSASSSSVLQELRI